MAKSKAKLVDLLTQLTQDGLVANVYEREKQEYVYGDEQQYFMTIRKKLGLSGNSYEEVYINFDLDDSGRMYHITYIINFKDKDHTFIDLGSIREIRHIAYAVLNTQQENKPHGANHWPR